MKHDTTHYDIAGRVGGDRNLAPEEISAMAGIGAQHDAQMHNIVAGLETTKGRGRG